MKYIDEFRDSAVCKKLVEEISNTAHKNITLMEVCGTHTMAIFQHGIKSVLPSNIKLISGPGCPVCVTPNYQIDEIIAYSRMKGVIITTFGDMIKVPGSSSSLNNEKTSLPESCGRDIRIVYSPLDAVEIAYKNPKKTVIFFGVGFETTSPTVAASIQEAQNRKLKNYFVLSAHKLIPPAMKAILDTKEVFIDGFILPGHVSTIIGVKPYKFIVEDYKISCCVIGFEPVDILQGINMLVKQINKKKPSLENQYKRSVKAEGNKKAQALLDEVFEPADSEWRGIGVIPESGLKLRSKYVSFDVEKNIDVNVEKTKENPACICGAVLRGVKTPIDCRLFRKVCTPENPIGACMVSSEGSCAAYYRYSA